MSVLQRRSLQPELMDDVSVSYEEFAETLRQLESINRWTGAYAATLHALEIFQRRHRGRSTPLRILDIGCGYGDTLRQIARWGKVRGFALALTGIDLNPWSKRAAEQVPRAEGIRFITQNIFDVAGEEKFDVVINSLFMHHLDDAGILRVLGWMTRQAEYGWFISDLHRHAAPYYFIYLATRLCGYNRLIRHDAPLSVARSFRREDWECLIQRAGLDRDRVEIRWHWPFRWGVCYDAA